MRIIGIDPGLTGAIALLDGGDLVDCWDMPHADGHVSAHILATLIEVCEADHAVLEMPGPMPKQGVSSTWKFARSVGAVEGVIAGLHIPLTTVRPAVWKRAMWLSADKGASRALAAQYWPGKAPLFVRVRDDGRAEAALIASWYVTQGRRP